MATSRTTGRRELNPADDEEFMHQLYRGGELLAAGKVIEAKDHLEKAFQLQPKNEKGQNLLGLTYFKLGLFDRAAEIYESLVQDNPADPTLRVNLGLVYLKTNALQRATREFETATDLDPDHRKAQNYLGLALAQGGEYGRAREHFLLAGSDAMAEKMSRAIAGETFERPPEAPPVRQSGFSELEGRDVVSEHGGEQVDAASYPTEESAELPVENSEAADAAVTAPGEVASLPSEWADSDPPPPGDDVHADVMEDPASSAEQAPAPPDEQDWGAEFTEQPLPAPPSVSALVPEQLFDSPAELDAPPALAEPDPATPLEVESSEDLAGGTSHPADSELDPIVVDPGDILLEATPDDVVENPEPTETIHHARPPPFVGEESGASEGSEEPAPVPDEELELTGQDEAVNQGNADDTAFDEMSSPGVHDAVTPIPSALLADPEVSFFDQSGSPGLAETDRGGLDDPGETSLGEATALGDVLPRTQAPGAPPEGVLPLIELAPSLQLFPGTLSGPFHLRDECAAIVVHDEMLTRLHGVLAVSGALDFEPEMRRVRGRASDRTFGDGDKRMLRARGQGIILVGPEDQKFVSVELGDESGYFREETVFAFEEPLMFENGRVPSEGGPDLELVHLRGKGRVLLRIFGAMHSLEVTMSRPTIIPAPHLVGWHGNLTPRVVPLVNDAKGKTARSGVELSGEGYALIAVALG